ncbi:MAG: hypothetical protein C4519_19105 [Desulfobacteraceae bacterium]|nr:MAG: hypothetical protein C4519_19105 [Desulfobacteraceae bacterium]
MEAYGELVLKKQLLNLLNFFAICLSPTAKTPLVHAFYLEDKDRLKASGAMDRHANSLRVPPPAIFLHACPER